LSRLYFGRFSDVHIGGPSSNQAAASESQMIHPIQLLPGRTLRSGSNLTRRQMAHGVDGPGERRRSYPNVRHYPYP